MRWMVNGRLAEAAGETGVGSDGRGAHHQSRLRGRRDHEREDEQGGT